MKYSIIMPYLKRARQFKNTLLSFVYHYAGRDDYEIIIGEDIKNFEDEAEHKALHILAKDFSEKYGIKIAVYDTHYPGVVNPCMAYNACVKKASGKFLVITNPECLHKVNVLKGFDEEFDRNPDVYVMCSCESARDCVYGIERFEHFTYKHEMWYQHSRHNNRILHFCSAISLENYNKIGGFDEGYQHGVSYDDDDFRETIKSRGIPIRLRDDLHVVHQHHDRTFQVDMNLTWINIRYFKKKWES